MAPTSIKTSLLLIAQLNLALGLALAPRAVTCNYETAASSGDTCTSFAAGWGLTLATFESLNPTASCPTLVVGQSYCVVGSVSAAAPTTSSTSSTSSTTSMTSTSSSSSSTSTVSNMTTTPSSTSFDSSSQLPPTKKIRRRAPSKAETKRAENLRAFVKARNNGGRVGDIIEIPDSEDEDEQPPETLVASLITQTPRAIPTERPPPENRGWIVWGTPSPEPERPIEGRPNLVPEPEIQRLTSSAAGSETQNKREWITESSPSPEPERPMKQPRISAWVPERPTPSEASSAPTQANCLGRPSSERLVDWLNHAPEPDEDKQPSEASTWMLQRRQTSVESIDLTGETANDTDKVLGRYRGPQPVSSRAMTDRGGGVESGHVQAFIDEFWDSSLELASTRAESRQDSLLRSSRASSPPLRPASLVGRSLADQFRDLERRADLRQEAITRERARRYAEQESRMPLADRSQRPDRTDPSEVNGARFSDIARRDGGVPDGSLRSLPADQGLRHAEEQRKLEEMRRKVRENGPQPTKKRIRGKVDIPDRRKAAVKWSAEEIGRLVALFQEHLGQWATMKRADEQSSSPRLTIRTSVDLKDKMRTLKKWLLRNGFDVPENMVGIRLRQHPQYPRTSAYPLRKLRIWYVT
ncbi:Peptidoglycan-binding Lysin subgroup [Penicillium odoratum]|uniref:Peptidoglycan-binding Lysin subgroup n=1 Tax=Penicillium odoratum TaxID=1167516 RepID=UPI0025492EDE|nr:Peptidoglycan-binding Lysin subgroup [Penicillium odoratum]KAJ5753309.1 Peptidoglycan-binding Lysin subgroup [Penicillium odoratum]